jgi:hypothetical protein
MQLSDTMDVRSLIGAVSLDENTDSVVHSLVARLVQVVEQWPAEALSRLLDEIADGMSLADPYRAGVLAWACGCLEEIGHSTPASRTAILQWAESTVGHAAALRDRVCESLQGGALSPADEFHRRREELRAVMPREYRAWAALDKWYVAATSVLVSHPELRASVRHVYDQARDLARYHRAARHLANVIRIPHEEAFLILEPARGRGIAATVSDIESMMHFLPAISQAYADTFSDPALALPDAVRRTALAHGPSPAEGQTPFHTRWTGFHWNAVRDDGTLPVMNEDPLQEVYGRNKLFVEDHPWDARLFAGWRVILLQPTTVDFIISWSRNYLGLRPGIRVDAVLGPDEVRDWVQRFAWVKQLNGRGSLDAQSASESLHFELCAGIAVDLPGRWYTLFLARSLRRLVPLARRHWAPLPFELLEKLLRVLSGLERLALGGSFDAAVMQVLAAEVSDRATRADESGLVSPIVMSVADGTRLLCEKVSRPDVPAGFDSVVLHRVQEAWLEAVKLARLAGHRPDLEQMKRALLADRTQLTQWARDTDGAQSGDRDALLGNLWLDRRPDWWPLLGEYPLPGHDYEVALSFAGRDRDRARLLASALVQRGCRVFFDESKRGELFGQELSPLLHSVYRERALFCVVFISIDYAASPWTRLEWSAAVERAAADAGYVLPVRIDDTALEGLPTTVAYLDLRTLSDDQFHDVVVDRVTARITAQLKSPGSLPDPASHPATRDTA